MPHTVILQAMYQHEAGAAGTLMRKFRKYDEKHDRCTIRRMTLGKSGASRHPLSGEFGTHERVKARFWFWRSVKSPEHHSSCPSVMQVTQWQMDGFFGQFPYKCHLEEVASVGDGLKICPELDSRMALLGSGQRGRTWMRKCWFGTPQHLSHTVTPLSSGCGTYKKVQKLQAS